VRTPYGRRGGSLAGWHPVDLAAELLRGLCARSGLAPDLVDEVVLGCGSPVGAQGANIARRAVLAAGWPEHIPGLTVDGQAASSGQAVHLAVQGVMSGERELVVAGGVDVMTMVPLGAALAMPSVGKPLGLGLAARYGEGQGFLPPGRAAEAVARRWSLTRADLDGWAAQSSHRALAATRGGLGYLHPVALRARAANGLLGSDEGVLAAVSLAELAALSPIYEVDGLMTAANVAVEADGAAAVLVASPEMAARLGTAPKARLTAMTAVGDDPALWPVATVTATRKALSRAGLKVGEVDRYEVHESCAAAILAWLKETRANPKRVNPDGGCLASGSPMGAAGAGLFAAAVSAVAEERAGRVVVTIAGDGGVATACLVGRP
jgi:acetyl-CoA acyltransferase